MTYVTHSKRRRTRAVSGLRVWYRGAARESMILKLLLSFSVALFIALFIQPTRVVQPVLCIDAIDKNRPLPTLKEDEGGGKQVTR